MRSYFWNPQTQIIRVLNGSRTRDLIHIERHGYSASHWNDTALSILHDCLSCREAETWYQIFAHRVIRLRRQCFTWVITEEEIKTWLALQRQKEVNRQPREHVAAMV